MVCRWLAMGGIIQQNWIRPATIREQWWFESRCTQHFFFFLDMDICWYIANLCWYNGDVLYHIKRTATGISCGLKSIIFATDQCLIFFIQTPKSQILTLKHSDQPLDFGDYYFQAPKMGVKCCTGRFLGSRMTTKDFRLGRLGLKWPKCFPYFKPYKPRLFGLSGHDMFG